MKAKLDTLPSGLDAPFRRNPSSTSIRSISASDVLSTPPPNTSSPPKTYNESPSQPYSGGTSTGSALATALNSFTPRPASPSVSVSAFTLPADKKEEVVSGRERGSFDQTRGNWGNRIVLTTYPGQSNVGTYHHYYYV